MNALFALLVGAASGAPLDEVRVDGLDIHELSRVDVRGTRQAITLISQSVDALSPAQRAEAAASLQFLVANCPYTRSALMLPVALHAAAREASVGHAPMYAQWDWAFLQEGLATHVAVLDALGVTFSAPQPGDALFGYASVIDQQALLAADDPIAAMAPFIEDITVIAADIDRPTADAIERHSARVERATEIVRPCPRGPWSVMPGQPWTLGMQLGGWHDALRRLAPAAEDAERLGEMVALLDGYSAAVFASAE